MGSKKAALIAKLLVEIEEQSKQPKLTLEQRLRKVLSYGGDPCFNPTQRMKMFVNNVHNYTYEEGLDEKVVWAEVYSMFNKDDFSFLAGGSK